MVLLWLLFTTANGIASNAATMTANGIRSSNGIGNDAVTTTATDNRSPNGIGSMGRCQNDGRWYTQSLKGIGSDTVLNGAEGHRRSSSQPSD